MKTACNRTQVSQRHPWQVLVLTLISISLPGNLSRADDAAQLEKWKNDFDQKILPLIRERCLECHEGDGADGDFDLGQFENGAAAASKPEIWERVGKKIRLNEMPPAGSTPLNDPQKGLFYAWLDSQPQDDLCAKLATDETQAWYRGVVMSRRLTRTEYLNAIQDVVGLEVDPVFNIPSDGAGGEGFDTNGDSLFTSPIHIEQYLAVADQLINRLLSTAPSHSLDGPNRLSAAQQQLLAGVLPRETLTITEWLQSPAPSQRALAAKILERFAWRAWRRPIAQQEKERLLALYDQMAQHDTAVALGQSLKAVLISPNFLFVVETETPEGGVQKLTQHQLATRLALFLWSSAPPAWLLEWADRGELETQEQIVAATRLLLEDSRANALGENFGLQWLGLSNFLTRPRPDQQKFPEYNEQLSEDLRNEAIQTIAAVFRQDRSVRDLVAADWVQVNQRLADHYGLPWPSQQESTWATLPVGDSQRGGVITLGATLVSTSYPARTSPVLRGRWLLEELLGARVPPPPAGVPALEESEANHAATLRERLELHRKDPACAACHDRMDPLGFGLENFDALGRWRQQDEGKAIDASGKTPAGDSFNGPGELKQIVLKRAGDFDKHLTRKLLGFALGRGLNKFDNCVIDDCLKNLNENDHRASVLIETIVTSYPFQHRYFKAKESDHE